MPLPVLSVPQFPNIPMVPGVPPIARSPAFPPSELPPFVSSDSPTIKSALGPQQWGIFDSNGTPVIQSDSVVEVDFANEYRISDYPIENGGFESYNKVATPFDARLIFTKGGNDSTRASFLASAASALQSLNLYSVLTPEVSYANANVIHYDYRRTAKAGATLITLEVWLREVRVTVTSRFTKSTSATSPLNTGTVQAQPLTEAEITAIRTGDQVN